MPLSELLRLATGKFESGQQKPCSTLVSSKGEDDLVELVWENGQILMRSQSSKSARSLAVDSSPSNTNKTHDCGVGHAATEKTGKSGGSQSVLDDMALLFGSGELALCQGRNMAPLLKSYPSQGHGPDALWAMSGVSANSLSSFVSVDKRSENGLKGHVLCSSPSQHCQTSDALGSGVSDTTQGRYMMNDSSAMKMEMQKNERVSNNSTVLNFSHFTRALVSAQLSTSDGIRTSVSSSACAGSPMKAILIDRSKNMSKDTDFHDSTVKLSMINSKQVVNAQEESCPPERTMSMCRKLSMETNTGNSTKGLPDDQRMVEPAVASSSACSGNGADRVSCEQTHNSKRKFCDTGDSECHSTDDIDAESTGLKKQILAQGDTASKRSRAAAVHNLSERRRRDRINKKMRALQELIPNCNKVDKASMLEEAIEYLKTLQLQVQIMSMGGARLCMPSMMIPNGIQHMLYAHAQRISPVGLGMGMRYGMGMPGITGGAPGYPIFPMSSMQAPHFPSSMLGPSNFQTIPAPNLYGHLNQGLPNFAQRAPMVPSTGQPPAMSSMGLSFLGNVGHKEVPNAAPTLSLGNPTSNMNSRPISNGEPGSSVSHKSNQLQTTNENKGLDQSATEQERNKYCPDAVGHTTLTSSTATDISKEAGHD